MFTRFSIHFSEEEMEALRTIADAEMRGIREQVRFLVTQELIRRKFLKENNIPVNVVGEEVANELTK
jgi:hypothetical protein